MGSAGGLAAAALWLHLHLWQDNTSQTLELNKPASYCEGGSRLSYLLLASRGLPPEGLQVAAALLGQGVGPVPTHLEGGEGGGRRRGDVTH